MEAYRANDYTRALAFAEHASDRFPERAKQTLHWRICLTAVSGKQEQSLQLFKEALTQGYCYPPAALEKEPDLNSLRDVAAFRELLEVNNQRFAEIQERVVPGGFSNGGGLAIWLALHRSMKTRGFIVLGPTLTAVELEALTTLFDIHTPVGLRGYIIVGEEDTWSLETSRKIAELMHAHDLSCKLEIQPDLDHSYPPHFAECLAQGLAFVEQS